MLEQVKNHMQPIEYGQQTLPTSHLMLEEIKIAQVKPKLPMHFPLHIPKAYFLKSQAPKIA